jgi:hypothetical protein
MRASRLSAGLAICALAAVATAQPAVAQSTVWLNVEIREPNADGPKVRINVPVSMMEMVVDSMDTAKIFREMHDTGGIDLAALWRTLKDTDTEEFIRIDHEDATIQVFKADYTLRVVVQEAGYGEPNIQVNVPFAIMDYIVEGADNAEFRLSELIERLRGHLPLVLIEATQTDEIVKVWLEER